ncbi:MAG TPA: LuxR C-terminal-related transcriptional regulator [Acidimicrobiales bacterium]|nr:LuxR C-terminal-related transcriptional regulator [Acidimicrobiales bacterium]
MRVPLIGREALLRSIQARTRAAGGVLLVGDAGVGKSRLLDEVLARRTDRDWFVQRHVATAAAQTIAFGAVCTLLPQTTAVDGGQLLARVRTALVEEAAGRRILLGLDDAHLLDASSTALLCELAHRGDAVLLLSARTGEPLPPAISGLWTSGLLDRTEVPPLDRSGAGELAAHLLGGDVDEALVAALVASSGGSPLLLRELVLDGRSSGAIVRRTRGWELAGSLRAGPRVQDLVRARAQHLGAPARALLETICVGEPLGLGTLQHDEATVLDGLERIGLAVVEAGGAGPVIRAAHPLVSDAVVSSLSVRRRIELERDLAARLIGSGPSAHGDALRAARWLTGAGAPVPGDVLTTAATEALAGSATEEARDLADRAVAVGAGAPALLIVAETARRGGRPEESDAAARRALELATTDEERVEAQYIRALLLTHHFGDPAAAVTLLEETAAEIADPALADHLGDVAVSLAGPLGGYPTLVEETAASLESVRDGPSEFWLRMNLAFAQVMLGRLDRVEEHIERALELAPETPDVGPELVDFLWAMRTGVHVQRGELASGGEAVARHMERCALDARGHATTAAIYGQLLLHAGSTDLFAVVDDVGAGRAGPDPFGATPILVGTAALGHLRCGRPEEAATLLAQVPDDLSDDRALPFVGAARAALLDARGAHAEAAELLEATGRRALETTHIAFGVVAMHALVGAGAPGAATRLLAELPPLDGAMLRTMVDHATAWLDSDVAEIAAAGTSFASYGALPHAATAFAQTAGFQVPGSPERQRHAARAAAWAAASAPFRPVAPVPATDLSERELDICRRAADGERSRDIGDALFLSVRTVDNHLRSAYRKLELGSRQELADVLAPLPPR